MIHIIVGKSASGKDTFKKQYMEKNATPIITYTTRPKRDGEIDGVDYYFISPDEFDKMKTNGRFLETRSYNVFENEKENVWYYGSPIVDDPCVNKYVVILDIDGANSYIDMYGADNIDIIYLEAFESVRECRAKNRGSFDKTEWDRRVKDDNIKFSDEALLNLRNKLGKKITIINNSLD